jgi:hypothetical protein
MLLLFAFSSRLDVWEFASISTTLRLTRMSTRQEVEARLEILQGLSKRSCKALEYLFPRLSSL